MDLALSVKVVFPLICFMAAGKICRLLGVMDEHTSSGLNSFCFKVLLPCTMFNNVIKAGDALGGESVELMLWMLGFTLVWFVLLNAVVPLFIKDTARQASFIQGGFRGNCILFAVAVAERLFAGDDAAIGTATVCVSFMVPVFNVLAVLLFEGKRKEEKKTGFLKLLKDILTTPLVFSALLGLAVVLLKIKLPEFISAPIKDLAACANPLALVVLGADLELKPVKRDMLHLAAVCVIKLVLMPIAVLMLVRSLGFSGIYAAIAVTVSFAPVAVSSYSFAVNMGGDAPFAAEIVAYSTVFSILTVVLWVSAMQLMNLI